MRYQITPVPAPRQVRSDMWKPRPMVVRYRSFKDACRKAGVFIPDSPVVIFELPMPKSWSKKKRNDMRGQVHTQKPDIDNLIKALFDAVFKDDSHIAAVFAVKRWAEEGSITVNRMASDGTIAEIQAL